MTDKASSLIDQVSSLIDEVSPSPRGYRQRWGLADESDGEIIFNWWTLAELKITQERRYIFGALEFLPDYQNL